jgi:hypothetical protein
VSLIHTCSVAITQSDKESSGRASQSGNRKSKKKTPLAETLISERGVPPNADKHPLATTFLTAFSAQRYHKKLILLSKLHYKHSRDNIQ